MKDKHTFEDEAQTYEIFNWITHLCFIVGYGVAFAYSGTMLFFSSEGSIPGASRKVIFVSCVSLVPFLVFAVLSHVWKMIVTRAYENSKSVDEEYADKIFNKFDRTVFFRAVDAILIIILFLFVVQV